MSKIKSQPVSMIEEGRIKILDKMYMLHLNVALGSYPGLLVVGLSNGSPIPLIYKDNGLQVASTDTTDADSWYRITTIGGSSAFPTGAAVGECYYSVSGLTLASGDSAYNIIGANCKNIATRTVTLLQAPAVPCETIFYEIHDSENLQSLWKIKTIIKMLASIPAGDDGS